MVEPLAPVPEGFQVGDVITFAGRPKWWMRLAYWLRLAKPKPLKRFVITWSSDG